MAFKLAFSTLGCPSWTIEQVGEAGRRFGYDGIELGLLDGELLPSEVDAAGRDRITKALQGLEIACVDTSARFAYPDAGERSTNRRMAEQYLALAADLGAPMIRVFGGNLAEGQQ